jgi:hypothetical protein
MSSKNMSTKKESKRSDKYKEFNKNKKDKYSNLNYERKKKILNNDYDSYHVDDSLYQENNLKIEETKNNNTLDTPKIIVKDKTKLNNDEHDDSYEEQVFTDDYFEPIPYKG